MASHHVQLTPSLEAAPICHTNLKKLKAGVTQKEEQWGQVAVGNDHSARSQITLQAQWDVPPEVLFAIFTCPDNTALFRDIQRVGQRNVVHDVPGLKVVEVEQLGDVKMLWVRKHYATWLKVTEDSRDQDCMTIQFDLMKSDFLAHFSGRWELRAVKDAAGEVVGCRGELKQDVVPKGVPSLLKHVPVAGTLLRGVTMRPFKRQIKDVNAAVAKIKVGMSKGRAALDVLHELCGTSDNKGPDNHVVAHVLDDMEEDEDDEEEEEEEIEEKEEEKVKEDGEQRDKMGND